MQEGNGDSLSCGAVCGCPRGPIVVSIMQSHPVEHITRSSGPSRAAEICADSSDCTCFDILEIPTHVVNAEAGGNYDAIQANADHVASEAASYLV